MSIWKWVFSCANSYLRRTYTVFRAITMSVLIVDHWMNANTIVTIIIAK